ncbi:MAG: ROK family transcriptional regulator [Anaerolineales bacterium]|jgi:N-acetylglucosamine repressor|uniref:ROK family transcriptional regulator n=1 Tax=Candidatus Villigracilis vicinus TaxID=3140679 RepID=UPI0031363746|nr:ROK family transcriptional regulator [Anaerolineales bacterium]MBK9778974.1 ROK family transcriptional regulator [Anaerolineales bacterium]
MKKATHQQTKQHNRDLVLHTIFANESISRAEVARVTNLTRTTVSDVVNGLLEEGLVQEVGRGESIGGKTPILLSVVADARYLIGLNLAQDKFIGAILNLRGEIKEMLEVPVSGDDGKTALDLVYQIIDQLMKKKITPIVGIGVGTPGLVNTREGVVVNAVNLEWQNLPLGQLLEKKYKVPVSVLNDSQATAIGEYVYGGDHSSDDNLIVVNVKHGIGAGIFVNGRLFQGDGGGAGEIGHVVVQEGGELCRCGKYGCLETISSARAVLGSLKLKTLEQAQSAFENGDVKAQATVLKAARYLGVSLANLIGTLNIQKIVLTGDMTRFGSAWMDEVNTSMRNAALARLSESTQLEFGTLDYRACILGASAFLLLDDYSLLFSQEN